jgi:hypothetical protein
MKLLKELSWSLILAIILWLGYALSPFLDIASVQTAQIPVFKEQAFCFSVLPKQVVQSWVLEQQLESQDVAVQETLKRMMLQFKDKQTIALADFHFNLNGALAFYLIAHPKNQFSCIYLPGEGQKIGWITDQYYGINSGVFFFPNQLSNKQKQFFEQCTQKMHLKTKKFEARRHRFELDGQTYSLLWEEHAFALELPKGTKKKTRILRPNGFHLSCPLALSNLKESLHFLENIEACSFNYYGAQLNSKQELELDFEALLTFENDKMRTIFLDGCKRNLPDWDWAKNFVRVNGAVYAMKKEGLQQLFICSNPMKYIHKGKISSQISNSPLTCFGDPTLLTKLDNAGWAAAVLELFPIYRGISDFSARTASVQTNQHTIRWELKEEYYAAGEFLKLLGTAIEQ